MSRRVVVFLILLVLPLAGAATAAAHPRYAPEWPQAVGPSTQGAPANGANVIVWEERGADADDDWNVLFGWNGSQTVVPAGAGNQRTPAVWGSTVVYEDDRGGDWDLYAWDLTRPSDPAAETPVATGPGDQVDAAICGDLVAYVDHSRGNADIAVHDLSSGSTRFITSHAAAQVDPCIDGSTVAWADHRNGNWDIYACDLQSGKVRRLTASKADQKRPQIGQGRVVYQDRRNGNWDIYECVLGSGKERRLTTHKAAQTAPCIDPAPQSGPRGNVVYQDARRDAGDIWVREGGTGISKPVCEEAGAQTAPGFHGTAVVWTDARDGQTDVYACRLWFSHLTATAPRTPAYNAWVKITGELRLSEGAGRQVIHATANGRPLTAEAVISGDEVSHARYAITLGHIRHKVTVKVWYRGTAEHLPAMGGAFVVKPHAALSRPSLKPLRRPQENGIVVFSHRAYLVSGTLRPRHKAGSKAVTLEIQRKWDVGDWKVYRTIKPAVRNAGSASAYRAKVTLNSVSFGSYRIVAVHGDAQHTRTESEPSQIIRP